MYLPYDYYESEIKGKNSEYIKEKIVELKEEMQSIKFFLEMRFSEDYKYSPELRNMINVLRESIRLCIKDLRSTGEEYNPDKLDLISNDFQINIPHISKVVFGIGGYFGGYTEYVVEFQDEYLKATAYNAHIPDGQTILLFKNNDEILLTRKDFLQNLERLNIGEWRHCYDTTDYNPDIYVCDGTQWNVTVEYDSGKESLEYGGSNSYPYNFEEFQNLFGLSFADTYDEEIKTINKPTWADIYYQSACLGYEKRKEFWRNLDLSWMRHQEWLEYKDIQKHWREIADPVLVIKEDAPEWLVNSYNRYTEKENELERLDQINKLCIAIKNIGSKT